MPKIAGLKRLLRLSGSALVLAGLSVGAVGRDAAATPTGQGVTIAIIDTGIDLDHPELNHFNKNGVAVEPKV